MTTETLDLAAEHVDVIDEVRTGQIMQIDVEERVDVELLRDLIVDEHQRQTDTSLEVDTADLGNALHAALRRFADRPAEPFARSARVTCRRADEPISEVHEYARIGDVWVSPSDNAGRTWHDLVVEYDVLTVDGGG